MEDQNEISEKIKRLKRLAPSQEKTQNSELFQKKLDGRSEIIRNFVNEVFPPGEMKKSRVGTEPTSSKRNVRPASPIPTRRTDDDDDDDDDDFFDAPESLIPRPPLLPGTPASNGRTVVPPPPPPIQPPTTPFKIQPKKKKEPETPTSSSVPTASDLAAV